ncbi:Intraflagellar transport protein 46 [Phytophthora citrophthora]|uniref:Intraflagellar transport protein 46 n=1 Tax=Phytophthora citrophthora TaxID=4793 RepID=A0AAD9GP63_9STRA|nr:Intraflagellar transport protein 46 [Phytophthora citrophthora]
MSKREAKHDEDSGKDDSDEDISDSGSEESEDSSDENLSESDDDRSRNTKGKAPAPTGTKAAGSERALVNQPFDEAVDLSESEGSILSEDPNSPKKQAGGGKPLKNQPFDEALELSESTQEVESPKKTDKPPSKPVAATAKATPASNPVGSEMKNKPFDEEVDLSDSGDSVDTDGHPSPKAKKVSQPAVSVSHQTTPSESKRVTVETPTPAPKPVAAAPEKRMEPVRKPAQESASSSDESESGDEDDDEEDDDEAEESQSTSHPTSVAPQSTSAGAGAATTGGSSNHAAMMANAGGYKESDYAHLKVSHEIRELFQYIGRFKAQEIELETRLKCFIPEYIPAVGDMDAFLKVPRPDGQLDQLGLKMLDEPSLSQSDATVLDLQLRSTSKKKHGDIVVRSIENAEKAPKEIDRWMKSIADLHRTKPPPQVHYTKTMPDIESLMQVWPEEFEELLSKSTLPSADLDMSLEQYVRVICALLDIPVHKNVYESLHVLFTLYLEFRSNQHFMPLL